MSTKHESNTYLTNYNLKTQFPANAIIEINKVEEQDVYIYDVIAFKNEKGQTIVHRIVDVRVINGVNHYVMRGDANNKNDDFEPTFENFIGRYQGSYVKGIGIFILFMQSNSGITTVLAVFYNLGLFFTLHEKLKKLADDRNELLAKAIDYDLDYKLDNVDQDFVQYIYYKDFVYRFRSNEFLGKEKSSLEPSDEDFDSSKQIKKIKRDSRDETTLDVEIIDIVEEKKSWKNFILPARI